MLTLRKPRSRTVAWIRTIDQNEANGKLREIYEEQRRQAGAVANMHCRLP